MPNALISVTDKTGVVPLASELATFGYDILSTGGSAREIRGGGIRVVDISAFTGSPEMLGGRIKTLHPRVFGGILARPDADAAELREHDLEPIPIVIVNLYEFENTVAQSNATQDDAIDAIDIGGVSLIRAAAKNHEHVLVVVDPADYHEVCTRLRDSTLDREFRQRMAAKAFRHTAAYDATIAQYLSTDQKFPDQLTLTYRLHDVLRYGENPHQNAAFYHNPLLRTNFHQLQGKALSYNNIADTDAAVRSVRGLSEPACAIIKHANPCGLAIGVSLIDAYDKAFRTDPTSAFGGIIVFNRELDAHTLSHVLDSQFAEVVIAPAIAGGVEAVAQRRKSLRLLTFSDFSSLNGDYDIRSVAGGMLIQAIDSENAEDGEWRVLTDRSPSHAEYSDLRFAWHVVKYVKSNAIVLAANGVTTGIGAGQPNRVISVRIAAMRMREERLDGMPSVLASDAFFPFRDGIDEAAKAGITAVVQPAGSIRDDEVIHACNEYGIAMVATGIRHFKH